MHIKELLLLIRKNSPCGSSGFPLSLSEWSFTICMMPYNHKWNVLSASLNKTFPSFLETTVHKKMCWVCWWIIVYISNMTFKSCNIHKMYFFHLVYTSSIPPNRAGICGKKRSLCKTTSIGLSFFVSLVLAWNESSNSVINGDWFYHLSPFDVIAGDIYVCISVNLPWSTATNAILAPSSSHQ